MKGSARHRVPLTLAFPKPSKLRNSDLTNREFLPIYIENFDLEVDSVVLRQTTTAFEYPLSASDGLAACGVGYHMP